MATPVLAYPRSEDSFLQDTGASNVGTWAVLSQVHNSEEQVIAYYSRALSKPEHNYCTTRRELLAVVRAIENFNHPHLYGRKFTVRTDHASLQWLLSFKKLEGQLARWLQKLQSFVSVLHIGPERVIRMQMHYRGNPVLRQIVSNASAKKRESYVQMVKVARQMTLCPSKYPTMSSENCSLAPAFPGRGNRRKEQITCWRTTNAIAYLSNGRQNTPC